MKPLDLLCVAYQHHRGGNEPQGVQIWKVVDLTGGGCSAHLFEGQTKEIMSSIPNLTRKKRKNFKRTFAAFGVT